jgi:aspartyl protease family protein
MASGSGSLMNEVLSLAAVAVVAALGVAHYDKIKPLIEARLAPGPATTAPTVSRPAEEPRPPVAGSLVELKAGDNGHYSTEAEINGRDVEVMVDTGASTVALTFEDAERAGIYLRRSDFTHQVATANGIARVAPVMLDSVSIGDITVRNVQGMVAEHGKLGTTLLGMSFLSRLDRFEMRGGTLLLQN